MNEDMVVIALADLFAKSSKGKTKCWQVAVVETEEGYKLRSVSGYLGFKMTATYSSIIKGKNLGRSNETAPREQAIMEAQSKWQKKYDENYRETITEEVVVDASLRPMLAQKYSERSHDVVWPAAAQPKLNGVRCLAKKVSDTEIEYTSRAGKKYTTLGHLTADLLSIMEVGDILDGEVYVHDLPLNEITSAVKRDKTENPITRTLEYWVYDVVDLSLSFYDRFIRRFIAQLVPEMSSVKITPTVIVSSDYDFRQAHIRYTNARFEGTMIRNINSVYFLGHRSADLQKHKNFLTEEFLIVGGKEASGEDEGTIVFRCITVDGKEFDVRPEGSREYRRELFEKLPLIVGKFLTVRFQNLSPYGVPQFPVGVAIRDYE